MGSPVNHQKSGSIKHYNYITSKSILLHESDQQNQHGNSARPLERKLWNVSTPSSKRFLPENAEIKHMMYLIITWAMQTSWTANNITNAANTGIGSLNLCFHYLLWLSLSHAFIIPCPSLYLFASDPLRHLTEMRWGNALPPPSNW